MKECEGNSIWLVCVVVHLKVIDLAMAVLRLIFLANIIRKFVY